MCVWVWVWVWVWVCLFGPPVGANVNFDLEKTFLAGQELYGIAFTIRKLRIKGCRVGRVSALESPCVLSRYRDHD